MFLLILIFLFWFLLFVKLFLFWLWLWQLKEYRFGRFLAHFEAQRAKKVLSSLWRLKYPKFTKKIIVILAVGIFLAGLMLAKGLYLPTFLLIIFIPLFFQIPTILWRNRLIKKARKKRGRLKNLLVIGITGSYGKTSTKEFLYRVLAEKFGKDRVLKTKEHQNTEVGVSQCILNNLKPGQEIFVVEMGAYKRGEIKLLCDIAKPKIGILTGISEQHMATFGSQENIIKAKYELIESLPADGMAFFNAKNEYCSELYKKTRIKKFLYGQEAKFFGEENFLGALAVAKELGVADVEIKPQQTGLPIKKGIGGLNVIDSTYSANPTGVIAHLDYLKTFSGKKIIVMPCLIELGQASKEVHKRIGRKIDKVCDLAIITTKDRFKEIKEGAGEKALSIENPKQIFEKIKSISKVGDIILLEGRLPQQLIKWLIQ